MLDKASAGTADAEPRQAGFSDKYHGENRLDLSNISSRNLLLILIQPIRFKMPLKEEE
jgi:hypothetical protein